MGSAGDGVSFGVELSLGRGLADAFPGDQIAIVKHADGGRRVRDHWNPDTNPPGTTPDREHMYAGLREKLQDATQALADQGFDSVVSGMFWVEGAREARIEAHALEYESNFVRVIAAVRNDLAGDPSMPFIIAGLHPFSGSEDVYPFINELRQAGRSIAAADPLIGFVDTDNVSRRPFNPESEGDWWHFNSAGLLDLGDQLATAYAMLIIPEPSADFDQDGDIDGDDFLAWQNNFPCGVGGARGQCSADADGDGDTDGDDFLQWQVEFGTRLATRP